MNRLFILALLILTLNSTKANALVRGADISWCTEMENDGVKFYNTNGRETDIFALMKEIGMSAIRLRVWVDPATIGYAPIPTKPMWWKKPKGRTAMGLTSWSTSTTVTFSWIRAYRRLRLSGKICRSTN